MSDEYEIGKFLDFKMVQLRQLDRIYNTSGRIFREKTSANLRNLENQILFLESSIAPYKKSYKEFQPLLQEINAEIESIVINSADDRVKFVKALAKKFAFLVKNLDFIGIMPIKNVTLRFNTVEESDKIMEEYWADLEAKKLEKEAKEIKEAAKHGVKSPTPPS